MTYLPIIYANHINLRDIQYPKLEQREYQCKKSDTDQVFKFGILMYLSVFIVLKK